MVSLPFAVKSHKSERESTTATVSTFFDPNVMNDVATKWVLHSLSVKMIVTFVIVSYKKVGVVIDADADAPFLRSFSVGVSHNKKLGSLTGSFYRE